MLRERFNVDMVEFIWYLQELYDTVITDSRSIVNEQNSPKHYAPDKEATISRNLRWQDISDEENYADTNEIHRRVNSCT